MIKIYRVKAIDSNFVSVWFFDRKECKKIIKNIQQSAVNRLVCGSQHEIEESYIQVTEG